MQTSNGQMPVPITSNGGTESGHWIWSDRRSKYNLVDGVQNQIVLRKSVMCSEYLRFECIQHFLSNEYSNEPEMFVNKYCSPSFLKTVVFFSKTKFFTRFRVPSSYHVVGITRVTFRETCLLKTVGKKRSIFGSL